MECSRSHLDNPRKVPKVEGVVALGGSGQQLDHGLGVDLKCSGDDGGARLAEGRGVVAQVPVQDGAEDAAQGVIRDLCRGYGS